MRTSKTSPKLMLLTVSHSAARATDQAAALPLFGKINLMELQQVRRDHLPSLVVKCASLSELERRAAEIGREQPHYREEAAFVVHDEKRRRLRLSTSPLHISR
jgi:hypothetical protein